MIICTIAFQYFNMRCTPQLVGISGIEGVRPQELLGEFLHFFPLPRLLACAQFHAQQGGMLRSESFPRSDRCQRADDIAGAQAHLGIG